MPFVSKKTLDAKHAVKDDLRALAEGQKQMIEEHRLAREIAIQAAADAEKRAADLEARLGRLRDLLGSLGIDASEYEDGTALWPTYAAKLLSVRLVEQPEDVSDLLGEDTPDTVRTQAVMAARRLVSNSEVKWNGKGAKADEPYV